MRRGDSKPRAKRRQEMLRELAAEEAIYVNSGGGLSRAAEAIDALRRMRDGTYGICADCEKKIPAARLHAKPEATRCIACQTEYERRSPIPMTPWGQFSAQSA